MVSEATLIVKTHDAIDFTVADATGIEKGTWCQLQEPRTALASVGSIGVQVPAGIAAREKIASDGRTQLAMYRDGVFECYIGPLGCNVGDKLVISGANVLVPVENTGLTAISAAAYIVGTALETGTNNELINVHVRI